MLILLHLGAKGFDLGQGGEGGSPLGLNEVFQHKAAHPLGLKGHALGLGAFHQRDVQPAAVGKFHRGLDPVVVVGKICPLGDAQLIQQYFPAKIQRQGCARVAVDAPALVGILAVGAVLKNAVDGVAGGKHRLAARFHVGAGVGVKTGVAVPS